MILTISPNVRTLTRRAAITVGFGYLLLVVIPVTTASLLLINAGHSLAGFSLLGISVGVTVFSLLVVGFVWVLVRYIILVLSSFLTIQRRRVLCWADDLEKAHWWARLVRPSDRLAFLDPRSAEEKLDDELNRLQAQYVSGALSEVEFERRVDRLLWTKSHARASDDVDTIEPMSVLKGAETQRESFDGERIIR